jgi:hypothetical protein
MQYTQPHQFEPLLPRLKLDEMKVACTGRYPTSLSAFWLRTPDYDCQRA